MTRKDKTQGAGISEGALFSDFTESELGVSEDKPPEISTEDKPKKPRKNKVQEIPQQSELVVIGNDEAEALLDLIQPVTRFAAKKIYKISDTVAEQAFIFSPDHRRKINPPLIRVMNKWLPMLIKKFADELGLGIILFSVVNSQIKVMQMLDYQEKQRIAEKEKVITPITQAETQSGAAD